MPRVRFVTVICWLKCARASTVSRGPSDDAVYVMLVYYGPAGLAFFGVACNLRSRQIPGCKQQWELEVLRVFGLLPGCVPRLQRTAAAKKLLLSCVGASLRGFLTLSNHN